jgi:hypothetical protein
MSEWLDKLPSEHVQCRRLSHSWNILYWYYPAVGGKPIDGFPYQPPVRNTVKGDRVVVCECLRCGTQRFDQIAEDGEIIRRKYGYAEDYLRPSDAPKPTAAELNVAMIDGLPKSKRKGLVPRKDPA